MSSERSHIIFKGSVQGVGFRYTAAHIAGAYDVSGYVRNLSDGSVEVVAEGESPAVGEFVREVQKQMSHYISDTDTKQLPATGEYRDFGIRY